MISSTIETILVALATYDILSKPSSYKTNPTLSTQVSAPEHRLFNNDLIEATKEKAKTKLIRRLQEGRNTQKSMPMFRYIPSRQIMQRLVLRATNLSAAEKTKK